MWTKFSVAALSITLGGITLPAAAAPDWRAVEEVLWPAFSRAAGWGSPVQLPTR